MTVVPPAGRGPDSQRASGDTGHHPAVAARPRPPTGRPAAVPPAALVAAEVADAKQGERTVVLEMGDLLVVTDAFVVTSGRNTRQVKTIVEEVEAQLKRRAGVAPLRVEGLGDLHWVLMDYGNFVVHVFLDETRELYDLERLWGDAPRVRWEPALSPSAPG